MPVLSKGVDFTTGDQVSAANLDNLVDSATFASGAVDNSTTALSGGAIIVKDGGITTAKLASSLTLTTPNLGTPSAGTLTNCTGFPAANLAGTALPAAIVTSSLTAVGALNSGSITSGFGSIDIGTDTLAAGNTTITGTLSATGNLTLSSTSGTPSLYVNDGSAAGGLERSIFFTNTGAGTKTNWKIGAQTISDNTFQIIPSTAAGGSTYSTAVATFSSTGLSVTGTIVGSSTIQTSAGVAWGLGAANAVSPTSPNRTLTVTVAGTTYYIHAKTTND